LNIPVEENMTPTGSTSFTTSRALWSRRLAIVIPVVFFISSVFPATAGLAKDTAAFPKWWGPLDVAIAFVLAILTILMIALVGSDISKQAEEAAYHAYRFLTHGILALCVVFFLFGDHIAWTYCLIGFAWRAWLLLYSLPAWFNALNFRGLGSQPSQQ
jgi:hypothetical protein